MTHTTPRRRSSAQQTKHVALAFAVSQGHLHLMTQGIIDYMSGHTRWLLVSSAEAPTLPIETLAKWKGDGVIATITTPAERRAAIALRRRGIHVVTVSGALRDPGAPRVKVDNAAIGRLAADHILTCGYKQFAFYGLQKVMYSTERGRAFVEKVGAAGFKCTAKLSPNTFGQHPWQDEMKMLNNWLLRLRLPIGIFAVNDYRARLLINACRHRNLRIPQDVGIIGTDNNKIVCEHGEPKLTSIECNWQSVGYQAAQMLDTLMSGTKPPARDTLVPPQGVVKRASTDITLVENPYVAQTLAYIRDHLPEVFGVEKLVEASGMSRRALEVAFLDEMKCTPYRYLCSKRIELAKQLLTATNHMKLSRIARLCGFSDLRRFRVVFRRLERLRPTQYRKIHGA